MGQLGCGNYESQPVPVPVVTDSLGTPLGGIVAIAAGADFTLALDGQGRVWAWGSNASGQLGVPDASGQIDAGLPSSPFPVLVQSAPSIVLDGIASIAAGGETALAVKAADGRLWAWGDGTSGQLGTGEPGATAAAVPAPVQTNDPDHPVLTGIVKARVGPVHALALDGQGGLWVWGNNNEGELGTGGDLDSSPAAQLLPMTPVANLSAGRGYSLALSLSNGGLLAWGDNTHGQLGLEDSDGDGLPDWWEIAAGLNPRDPTDATRPAASGGGTNLQVYQAGATAADEQTAASDSTDSHGITWIDTGVIFVEPESPNPEDPGQPDRLHNSIWWSFANVDNRPVASILLQRADGASGRWFALRSLSSLAGSGVLDTVQYCCLHYRYRLLIKFSDGILVASPATVYQVPLVKHEQRNISYASIGHIGYSATDGTWDGSTSHGSIGDGTAASDTPPDSSSAMVDFLSYHYDDGTYHATGSIDPVQRTNLFAGWTSQAPHINLSLAASYRYDGSQTYDGSFTDDTDTDSTHGDVGLSSSSGSAYATRTPNDQAHFTMTGGWGSWTVVSSSPPGGLPNGYNTMAPLYWTISPMTVRLLAGYVDGTATATIGNCISEADKAKIMHDNLPPFPDGSGDYPPAVTNLPFLSYSGVSGAAANATSAISVYFAHFDIDSTTNDTDSDQFIVDGGNTSKYRFKLIYYPIPEHPDTPAVLVLTTHFTSSLDPDFPGDYYNRVQTSSSQLIVAHPGDTESAVFERDFLGDTADHSHDGDPDHDIKHVPNGLITTRFGEVWDEYGLLPVQLTNKVDPTKRNGANGKDMPISFKKDDNDTSIRTVAWIAAHDPNNSNAPRMPQLLAQLGGANVLAGMNVCWKLQVTFHDRHGNPHRDFDTGDPNDSNSSPNLLVDPYINTTTAAPDQVSIPNGWHIIGDGTPWDISQDPDWQAAVAVGFFGGDAVLSMKIEKRDGTEVMPQQNYKFRIAGEKPDADKAKAYISTIPGHPWYAYAIAKEETDGEGSSGYYNHFLTRGGKSSDVKGKEGVPNWNDDGTSGSYSSTGQPTGRWTGTGGYGLFQLTREASNPYGSSNRYDHGQADYIMPRSWIWNWQANAQAGVQEIQRKTQAAQGLFNGLNATYPESGAIPSHLNFSGLETIAITYYNGMSGPQIVRLQVNGRQRRSCWKPLSSGWRFLPNSENYVDKVSKIIEP